MHRWYYVILIIVTAAMGWLGLSRLNYNVQVLDLLPQKMEGLAGTRVMLETFQKANRLMMTLESPDSAVVEAASLSLAEHLKGLKTLCHKVSARPPLDSESGEAAGQELSGMVAFALLNAPPERVAALSSQLSGPGAQSKAAATLEELATSQDPQVLAAGAYDPLGLTGALFEATDPKLLGATGAGNGYRSSDGTFHLVFAEPIEISTDYHVVTQWLQRMKTEGIEAWKKANPQFAGVEVRFTGEPAFRAEISNGMEKDMSQSVGGITFIVGFLFWLLHRTIKPLLLLMVAILMTNLLTLGTAGLIYGGLNVMSMGFAAILTGMIEDFGVVALHEAQAMKGATWPKVCRRVLPGVIWSALTTAFVFGSLALSSLPGIAQLGTLTALGILIGAAIMLFGFLPLAMKFKVRVKEAQAAQAIEAPASSFRQKIPGWCAAALLVACGVILATKGLPGIHRGANVLRPVESEAFTALERFQAKMEPPESKGEWLPIVSSGDSDAPVAAAMAAARATLPAAQAEGRITAWYLPDRIFPNATHQAANLPILQTLAANQTRLKESIVAAGYEPEAFELAHRVLDRILQWKPLPIPPGAPAGPAIWPDPLLLEGTLGNLIQRTGDRVHALGFIQLPPGQIPGDSAVVDALEKIPGLYPAGWRYLNQKILPLVREEAKRICIPAGVVLLALMFVVFRGAREILLAVAALLFSGLILLAFMSMRGMEWNFVNIAAIPLSLGLGLDFTIHMIYALRRHDREGGDGTHGVGRALAYCGLSTGLGFGSLAVSGNTGLISMGLCCMVGVLATLFTAAFLLPWAWRAWPRPRRGNRQVEIKVA
ncbi:MAG: Lipid biosynthesis acyltransferase [Verrucomicrobiales bacterium]|nr:Lipid biosynthesis acyltransferase [Verrucomicrobiales bacterium]